MTNNSTKKQPMKIAFLVGKFPSLSETFILSQITGLLDAGHAVDIFAFNRPEEDTVQPEIEAYHLLDRTTYIDTPANKLARVARMLRLLPRYLPKHARAVLDALNVFKHGREAASLRLFYSLLPFLERGPYDILHCHFGNIGADGARLKRMGVPGRLVVAFHGRDISSYTAKMGDHIYDEVFQQADLLMPVSGFWKAKLIKLGADPESVQVHHMGIDVERFPFRPRNFLPGGGVRLLTVGRLVEKKGIAYGIRAVAKLCARHPDWNIQYQIIGGGEEHAGLEEVIRACGVGERVHLLGPATIDEVREQMLHAHLFLLPSHTDSTGDQEGIPVSIMEALATGMPVLSTHHTGVPELVEDGASGLLAQERDVDGLCDRLEQLILHPELWPVMGRRGRKRIEEGYDIQALNQKLIETYSALLDAPARRSSKSQGRRSSGDKKNARKQNKLQNHIEELRQP